MTIYSILGDTFWCEYFLWNSLKMWDFKLLIEVLTQFFPVLENPFNAFSSLRANISDSLLGAFAGRALCSKTGNSN